MGIRINKYLSESGHCSRREADRLIEQGRVNLNDRLAVIGDQVETGDMVYVDHQPIKHQESWVYIALNKPVGITSTTDLAIPGNIIEFMHYPERIFHIGRLDKDSEGLILMTNHGDIVNEILRAENAHEKEYIVTVDRVLSFDFASKMSKGVPILETVTKPCVVEVISPKTFRIILTEGLNRQIRRMCEYFGYRVLSLKRVRIMNITLDVPVGKYRHLTETELRDLFQMLEKNKV
jgi:23S rRNA pseudouridine2604 synthase